MMRHGLIRLISVMLSILLVLSGSGGVGLAERQKSEAFAPDTVHHGFRVYQVESVRSLGLDLYFMEHEKTGAQLIYVSCDDQNRTFGVAFRTQGLNDKGLPHVFEHSVLAGSEKYPDSNLVFSMMNQTYNTYINAETRRFVTLYPIASLSEEQLFTDMDVYMSGVLNPTLLRDEHAMMREAWHYNLDDPEGEITVSGIVYSEMAALYNNMQYVTDQKLAKMLFPGSYSSNDVGGDPAVIPEMTWQELLDFHAKYYHPSNMLMMLYGDFTDIERFLRHLDSEYLSGYERVEICLDDPGYQPPEGYRELFCKFPAAQGAETAHTSTVTYAFVLHDPSRTDYLLAAIASAWLTTESSPLMQRVHELFPVSGFTVSVDNNTAQPTLRFLLMNADPEDAPLFRKTIDEMIPVIAGADIDESFIDLMIRNEKYQQATSRESQNVGVGFFNSFADSWSRSGRADAYLDDLRFYGDLEKYKLDGSIHTVLGKLLLNASASAMLVMTPEPGMAEVSAAKLASDLAEMKAAMSDEEIRTLIAQCADYNVWIESNSKISLIDRVKAVSAESLPEEYETAAVTDQTLDGTRWITSEIPGNEVFKMSIYLDAQGLSPEGLLDASLAASLLGQLGTENYGREALQSEMFSRIFTLTNYLAMVHYDNEPVHPYLCISGDGLIDQLEDTYTLAQEIVLRSDFTDYDTIRKVAADNAMMAEIFASAMPEAFVNSIGKAATCTDYYLDYYIGCSPEYIEYNKHISMMDDVEIAEVARRLQDTVRFMLNRPGAVITVIGSAEAIDRCVEESKIFLSMLGSETHTPVDYGVYSTLKGSTALVIDTPVAYNSIFFSMNAADEKFSGRHLVAQSLITDMILLPELRFRNNAYGASCVTDPDFFCLSSYRDPNVAKTYEVFSMLPERLRALEMTEDELDGYITAAYSSVVQQRGPITKAEEAVNDALLHLDPGRRLRLIREIKGTTVGDIRALAVLYERIVREGTKAAGINEAMLADNTGLFENVLRLSDR